jgi:hypothetical protein
MQRMMRGMIKMIMQKMIKIVMQRVIQRRTIAIIALLLAAGFLAACTAKTPTGNAVAPIGATRQAAAQLTPSGQGIKLVASDTGQYTPDVIRVKQGSVVRIEGDPETLVGGMDTVIVDDYGVQKKIAPNDNVLEFTADKQGEFLVHCANGMGNGKLIVEP